MTHEQFITELASLNQAAADIQEEMKRLFKAVNVDNEVTMISAAYALESAAAGLRISANAIRKGLQTPIKH